MFKYFDAYALLLYSTIIIAPSIYTTSPSDKNCFLYNCLSMSDILLTF